MRYSMLPIALLVACAATAASAQDKVVPMTDKERIDSLLKQNQLLIEENARLAPLVSRPMTREEAFVQCMQATKGQTSAMAAESIGMRCDRLLARK